MNKNTVFFLTFLVVILVIGIFANTAYSLPAQVERTGTVFNKSKALSAVYQVDSVNGSGDGRHAVKIDNVKSIEQVNQYPIDYLGQSCQVALDYMEMLDGQQVYAQYILCQHSAHLWTVEAESRLVWDF
jgi:hypothetical protein